ncbi:MAG: pyridoxamine 5-phosphate oxidase [Frankiales bacterium]|nr:pyridoxamine 5-phosphate oxidase [Frankiales bacterium]
MTSWSAVPSPLRELAEGYLTARTHLTMATLRADGSPRISGTELAVADGELWLGSMPGARKAADLLRDPRVAVHSGSEDPLAWRGDAKVAGRAVGSQEWERAYPGGSPAATPDSSLFRLDVQEVSVVELAGDHLVITSWTPEVGLRSTDRR